MDGPLPFSPLTRRGKSLDSLEEPLILEHEHEHEEEEEMYWNVLRKAVLPVRVTDGTGLIFQYRLEHMCMDELRAVLLDGTHCRYLAGPDVLHHEDGTVREAAHGLLQSCFDGLEGLEHVEELGLWMGCHGQRTRMHFDLCHNVLTVLEGTKHIILAPPEDFLNIYTYTSRDVLVEGHSLRRMYRFSRANVRDPADWQAFPRLQRCHFREVLVKAGESLLIPCGWFHDVLSESTASGISVAINCFFGAPSEALLAKHKWMRVFIDDDNDDDE